MCGALRDGAELMSSVSVVHDGAAPEASPDPGCSLPDSGEEVQHRLGFLGTDEDHTGPIMFLTAARRSLTSSRVNDKEL